MNINWKGDLTTVEIDLTLVNCKSFPQLQAHGSTEHECCFCPKSYSDIKDLKKHISYTHWRKMGKYLLPCKECNLALTENECVAHNRIEHGNNR